MSRRNKKYPLKKKVKDESKTMILNLFIGGISFYSFFYSIREYNNFTIISFGFLSFIFFFSGVLITSLLYFFRTNKTHRRLKIYDFFVLKILIYGSICSSLFFLTNNYFSTNKEYIKSSPILKRYKAVRNSPNSIVTEIDGEKREINIHNYEFQEIQDFNNVQLKMKNGFWNFQIIKEVILIK